MNDLISREAAIEAAYQGLQEPANSAKWERILGNLKAVPSAQQWIPCSERLPEKQLFINTHERSESSEYVLVTIKMYNNPFCDFIIRVARYDYVKNSWIILNANAEYIKVTAWCPLPEPYVDGEE